MAKERIKLAEVNGTEYDVFYNASGPYILYPCKYCGNLKTIYIRRKVDFDIMCFNCNNSNKERAKKISISKTGIPKTEEEKRKISKSVSNYRKENPFTEEEKLSRRNVLKGKEPWNKGKELTKEDKLHKSIAQKIAQPKYANIQKERWNNLSNEEKQKRISKSLSVSSQRPNIPEMKVMALLNFVAPGEYKYTGNGEIVIGNMCPDFTNINGQKKVIEEFGDYWHRGEDPQNIIDAYLTYGFKCLVIWERELRDPENVIEKIRVFHRKEYIESPKLTSL